LCKNVL